MYVFIKEPIADMSKHLGYQMFWSHLFLNIFIKIHFICPIIYLFKIHNDVYYIPRIMHSSPQF